MDRGKTGISSKIVGAVEREKHTKKNKKKVTIKDNERIKAMYIDGIDKSEYYNLEDVFGREKIFYLNSTLRIIGWETPISIIYLDGEKVKACFKKELFDFAKDYVDPPYKKEDSVFDNIFEEEYYSDKSIRKLQYALKKYKEAGYKFEITKLFPDELKEKLKSDEYFGVKGADVFCDIFANPHDCNSYWFPVDVDAIIINDVFPFEKSKHSVKAEIVFVHDYLMKRMTGFVGYDGLFYAEHGVSLCENEENVYLKAFSVKDGLKNVKSDIKIKRLDMYSAAFLKNYIVAYDGTCYDYDGELCERETTHHQNVNFINGLIHTLSDFSKEIDYSQMHLEMKAPDMIYEVNVDVVENLIVPSLKSIDALNKKAYNDFLEIKKLIVYAGLSRNFEKALLNIKEMNKSKVFGGSSRGFASKRLLESLNILKKRTSKNEFMALLNNDVELRKRIAKINGTKVVEIAVSDEDFTALMKEKKVSKEINKSELWQSLQPHMLVVFTKNKNEHFWARIHKQGSSIVHKV